MDIKLLASKEDIENMKFSLYTFIAIALCCNSALAKTSQLFFLQQLEPGHIVYASIMSNGESAIANVAGMGASNIKKDIEIDQVLFSKLWNIVSSEEFSGYLFEKGSVDDLANPSFYTISLRVDSSDKTYFRIPINDTSESARILVSTIQGLIGSGS